LAIHRIHPDRDFCLRSPEQHAAQQQERRYKVSACHFLIYEALMEEIDNDHEQRRPLAITLMGGLYLFFFMLTISTFGYPFPFMGTIYQGRAAEVLVFVNSLACLYLFLGLMKRQTLTWYLLIGYNCFELVNSLANLLYISVGELQSVVGKPIDTQGLRINNLSVMVAIILLTAFIYRHRQYFTNRSKYLF
jgi:hypothetical protein